MPPGVLGAGEAIFGAVTDFLIIVILTIYFLADMPRIRGLFYRLVPHSRRPRAILIGDDIMAKVGGYVLGNLVISIIAGVLTFAWLLIFGVPYAFLLAILVALLDLIPVVGSTIAGIVVALVALTVSLPVCLATIGFFVLYRFFEDYVLVPKIIGKAVDVPALVTVVAVLDRRRAARHRRRAGRDPDQRRPSPARPGSAVPATGPGLTLFDARLARTYAGQPMSGRSPPVVVLRGVRLLERRDLVRRSASRSRAATASCRWWGLVAPTIGQDTTGLDSTQARATCAIGTPRASATCWIASTTGWSTSRSKALATASADDRAVCSPQGRAARPLASGEYGVSPTPWSRHIGIMSRSSSRLRTLYWSSIAENVVQPCEHGGVLHLRELPRPHRRRAEVAHLAGPHHVVQRLHGLLDRHLVIETVDVVDVDVVGAQPPQRRVQPVPGSPCGTGRCRRVRRASSRRPWWPARCPRGGRTA